ncbi:hypothetical protein JAAARDRAFT_29313 [Jaapia argillacea MUCL 33604]|uniref:Uncharacterized protein n=1 Tax=Jaapia argillacea MUCL 33604 TaxID=933084 RepID=A0A067QAW3_9AGAM|nr:hypothetical protein JAAARDRAFT_29313 [Jaapia argillacea MUCL 33604]
MAYGFWLFCLLVGISYVAAYQVPVYDTDYSRQVCSGMWANSHTYINVTFDPASQGNLAMVIYEWGDMKYLGKVTSRTDDSLPKTYVCTSDAVRGGFCDRTQLGRFIIDLPNGKSINDTSFWSARVAFTNSTIGSNSSEVSSGFWDNPEGNPDPPDDDEYSSPWIRIRPRTYDLRINAQVRDVINESPAGTLTYTSPIQYLVRKTGYYCVAIVPVTVLASNPGESTDVPFHPNYAGRVYFRNTFQGRLPATDYPKVNFYFAMFLLYCVFGAAWGWLCYRHVQDLLPIQYYLSSLVGFLIVEMLANWAYYRYLNAHGKGTTSTVFLFVVAILDAGRNALSFFMLLVVSLGLSVVRESLGRTMLKCQVLAVAHFIFGVLYAVGIVELELESTSALVLLLFVIPLAFTLSGFLLWILYSLNATIAQLLARKQRYKLTMFKRLYHILIITVLVIVIFFVVSSFSFSERLAEDYSAKSWKVRWWLLDGWLALLYLVTFSSIAYLWRPSANNRRLAMSDEIAQDEEDAEDYDLEAIERRTDARDRDDDDDATLVGRRGPGSVAEDGVVFEIGDEDEHEGDDDDEDEGAAKKRRAENRLSGEQHEGGEEERQGLTGVGKDRDD